MTVSQALDVRQRSVSDREAEILLGFVMDKPRPWLHAHPESLLTDAQAAAYETCLQQREANQPVAYITGQKEFYGRPFACDARALIPRPETEGLIDLAMAWLGHRSGPAAILELGTGCGNIAVTLAAELAQRKIAFSLLATDLSGDALALAAENWQKLAPSPAPPLEWAQCDLFDHPRIHGRKFDLIIANLPYVPDLWKFHPDAQEEVVFHEPDLALFGGPDGLDLYRRFFVHAPSFLADGGRIIIEFNEDETAGIRELAAMAFPRHTMEIFKDYAGLDRVMEIRQ